MIKTALVKLLTLKAGAIVLAAGAGGVALAASTGAIPNPLASDKPSVTKTAQAGAEDSNGPGSAQGSPSPSLVGLCHAFNAGAGADKGKALENPAFKVLITTAGGKDKVEAYCTKLLASAAPSARSGAGTTSDDRPSGAPTTRGGKPSMTPTVRPSR